MSSNLIKTLRTAAATALACATACALAAPSLAAGPRLQVHMLTPDSVRAGESMVLVLRIQNVGDSQTAGLIYVVDSFGPWTLNPKSEASFTGKVSSEGNVPLAGPTSCEETASSIACAVPGPLPPGAQVQVDMDVTVPSDASGEIGDTVSVSGGGGAGEDREERTIAIGPPGPFGFTKASVELPNADGSADALAGSVPAEYVTKLNWRSFWSEQSSLKHSIGSTELIKDVVAHLPPGMIGNPSAAAICTSGQLASLLPPPVQFTPACPLDSQIGIVRVGLANSYLTTGLYNMVAPPGVATELGFTAFGSVILLDAYVRPGDHGVDVISRDTSTSAPISAVEVVAWGVPADHSHDRYRGLCLEPTAYGLGGYIGANGLECPTSAPRRAFLRTPTACSGVPLAFGAEANSYEHESVWSKMDAPGPLMAGCEVVPFQPDIYVDPTGTATSSPAGVSVRLSLPQNKAPDGLAEGDLKKAVVTLPEGMTLNPSSADGLQACDDARLHLDSNTPAQCPDGSKIGTVLLHTQLIPNPIEGWIYIRPQNSEDPESGEMFRLAIELRDDAHGLDFKLAGHVAADPVTGRLTSTFDDNPQFPFEDISLQFKSGARAPLVTPASCMTQTTEAYLYPWARPDQAAHRSSSFQLTSGPEGAPCPGSTLPFIPSLNAGVSDVEAGAFTSFLTTFSRSDADQSIQRVSVKLPKGLLGSLVGMPLCGEAQANAGTCSSASQIGTVTAGAGAGPTPFYVTGGKVFMTGPYEGAPFGLSVVVPAKAGPFDLGTVVVRSRVEVDVHTAQLTVTTDPLPQIVGGVPVDLRLVNVTIERPGFVFNPTDCANTNVTGTITGTQGSTAALSNPFQVTNCAALDFRPKFSVSTSGRTSRAAGASIDAKLSYPKTQRGTEVNIAKVKVSLPKALPSRLTTLQKACTAAMFEANPAVCPAPSRIGTATATTPVLPVPLSGPVYFVSHGGAAFPDLVIVLQGYGVTVDLVGTTFINGKTDVTSTTFKAVPDVPVGTFELKLPRGPYSALAANGSLCKAKLAMPTVFVAQDGAQIQRSTKIAVRGCAKHMRHQRRERSRSKK
jgi:hypothetical protein